MFDATVSLVVALTALATALTTLAVALTAMIAALRNGRRIGRVHAEVNGRVDQLLEAQSRASYMEGWGHGQTDPAAPPLEPPHRGSGVPPKSGSP